jgi:hypothetical protein
MAAGGLSLALQTVRALSQAEPLSGMGVFKKHLLNQCVELFVGPWHDGCDF